MAKSSDAGAAKSFHDGCDSKGATVTIVRTKEGRVFGGAADKSWASSSTNGYSASDSSFLFCINCAGAKPNAAPSQLKLTGKFNQRALNPNLGYGPAFGDGHDLHIANTPGGSSTKSSSILGHTYTCPAGQHGSAACDNYLAGSRKFTIVDYEVFVVKAGPQSAVSFAKAVCKAVENGN